MQIEEQLEDRIIHSITSEKRSAGKGTGRDYDGVRIFVTVRSASSETTIEKLITAAQTYMNRMSIPCSQDPDDGIHYRSLGPSENRYGGLSVQLARGQGTKRADNPSEDPRVDRKYVVTIWGKGPDAPYPEIINVGKSMAGEWQVTPPIPRNNFAEGVPQHSKPPRPEYSMPVQYSLLPTERVGAPKV